jgi:hypothetical protein
VPSALEGLVRLNAHEPSAFPCLCPRCVDASASEIEAFGMKLHREHATAKGRVLFYWLPDELYAERDEVRRAIEARMMDALVERR